jgi:hypothetical protein
LTSFPLSLLSVVNKYKCKTHTIPILISRSAIRQIMSLEWCSDIPKYCSDCTKAECREIKPNQLKDWAMQEEDNSIWPIKAKEPNIFFVVLALAINICLNLSEINNYLIKKGKRIVIKSIGSELVLFCHRHGDILTKCIIPTCTIIMVHSDFECKKLFHFEIQTKIFIVICDRKWIISH